MLKQVRDRRAEAQLDKGMSQTKVKSCMYASKLLTERSPVAKCVMIAEADMDAAESFCAAPDGTWHRDMARSESSARELGRPADAWCLFCQISCTVLIRLKVGFRIT